MFQLRSRFGLMGLLLAAVIFGAVVTGTAMAAYQGHMHAAQNQLQFALNQLNMAVPDKAGHRVQAISLVKQAMTQVQLGIQAGAR